MSRLTTLYNSLPRSGRWLAVFALFVAAYFGILEPVLGLTSRLNIAADQLRAGLERQRQLASADSEPGRTLRAGRTNFGKPALPGVSTAESLHRTVDSTLEKHGVHDRTKVEKQTSLTGAPPGSAAAIAPLVPNGRIERLVLDVSFETTPETLIAILADLERSKEVAAVSRVKIDKSQAGRAGGSSRGSRIIRATIAPEAWIIVRPTPAFGATAFNSGGFRP